MLESRESAKNLSANEAQVALPRRQAQHEARISLCPFGVSNAGGLTKRGVLEVTQPLS
jgi:hypothetical protein